MQLAKCGISPAWGLKNPTFEAVMRNYSPANWGVVAQSARRAYLWVCPTVGALAPLFGPRCPVMWLDEQVTHLFLTSQSRDASAAAAQIETFVSSFVGTVAEFKLTEVMLFLARYKAGVYGRSFAAFDVRNVGQTFHHEFVQQRRQELQAIEAEATAGRDGEERRLRAAHAMPCRVRRICVCSATGAVWGSRCGSGRQPCRRAVCVVWRSCLARVPRPWSVRRSVARHCVWR